MKFRLDCTYCGADFVKVECGPEDATTRTLADGFYLRFDCDCEWIGQELDEEGNRTGPLTLENLREKAKLYPHLTHILLLPELLIEFERMKVLLDGLTPLVFKPEVREYMPYHEECHAYLRSTNIDALLQQMKYRQSHD